MKQNITQASKRWLSLLLAVIMTVTMLPLSAINTFAFSTSSGQTVDSAYGAAYVGYDGADYPVGANHYALRYNADGSTYIEPSQIGTRRTKLSIIQNGEVMQALCIEYGIDISLGNATYVSANSANSAYFNMLSMTARRGIMLATIYGWQPGKALPIDGINEDDFSLATQEIIWEYQQGIRTSPTTRVNNGNIRADQFYDEIKGRPAELAYNWILSKMATHATVPSFTKSDRDSAPTHTLRYDAATQKYSITLTDTNNTGVDIVCTSGSGISVSRNGNKYTFTSSSMISNAVTLEYKKNISLYGDEFLVWGNVGHQTMMTGVSDPVRFYAAFNTETNGTAKIVKSSEDGVVSGINFKITGNGVDQTVTTDAGGAVSVQLLPGTYTVTEQTPNKYVPQQSQNITVTSGQTSTVTFNNVLKRGDVKVTKTAEDGLVSGIKFRLYGTSDSGASVDEYATTDNSGVATFADVLIGTYTLEEAGTAAKYITPAKQNVTVKWNEVVSAAFHNELKRGDVKVIKSAEDSFVEGHRFHLYGTSVAGTGVDMYAVTNESGIAEFKDVLVGTYTIEEVDTAEQYITPVSQSVTIEWDNVTEKNFENELKRGNVKVTKTSEDGLVSGVKFRLYGTSTSGATVELFATTNAGGVAEFKDVLIGTYTLEEVNTPERYIVPASQKTIVEWNKVTEKSFHNELKRGDVKVIKTSEDNLLLGHRFRLYGTSLSGEKVDLYAETNANGIAEFNDILIGSSYVIEEVDTKEWYIIPDAQNAVVEWNTVTNVRFTNTLKRGDLSVTKTCEDGLGAGHKFHLYGTSLSGLLVDLYATTDENGVVHFEDVLIGTGYTLEEVDTAIRYVIPEAQTADIEWNKVTSKSFENILKKWRAKVYKYDSEFTDRAQGDATLAGAVYGVYNGDELIDTYTTDENGYFITDYYVCGDDWTIREISPSEGYLLDTETHKVGASAKLYTVELNTVKMDVTEDVIKGSISIIKHCDDGSTKIETPEVGAEFKVYLTSAGSYDDAYETERDHLICDENGYAETKKLPYGTYSVEQIKGWDGREMMKPFNVTITENGKVYRYIINNAVFESYIKIVKVDAETGNTIPYAGAGFKLYRPDGTPITQTFTYPEVTVIDTFYTNDKGYLITPESLEYGTGYYLIEVTAPHGYVLNSVPVYFDVTADSAKDENSITVVEVTKPNMTQKGIIKLYKTGEVFSSVVETDGVYRPVYSVMGLPGAEYEIRAAEDPVTVNYHGQVIEVEIVNERIRGTVQLTKVDADYPENKLTGAEFEVYRDTNGNKQLDETDELIGKMGDVEAGVYKLTDLLYGGYFVKETVAPEGFYLDSTAHYFEITENGETVTVENEAGVGFINTARVGSLKIVKTSSNGKVDGFSFRVTGSNGYDKVFVTDENGEIVIGGLRLGDYTVSEVSNDASADYVLPEDKIATVFVDSVTIVEMHNLFRDTPQTGDDTNLLFWFAMAAVSGTGLVICMVLEVKARKKRKGDK